MCKHARRDTRIADVPVRCLSRIPGGENGDPPRLSYMWYMSKSDYLDPMGGSEGGSRIACVFMQTLEIRRDAHVTGRGLTDMGRLVEDDGQLDTMAHSAVDRRPQLYAQTICTFNGG